MLVEGHGWRVRLELYAVADFNQDGVEDLLVKTQGWLTAGTYATTRLLALTRFYESGPLQLVTEYSRTQRRGRRTRLAEALRPFRAPARAHGDARARPAPPPPAWAFTASRLTRQPRRAAWCCRFLRH